MPAGRRGLGTLRLGLDRVTIEPTLDRARIGPLGRKRQTPGLERQKQVPDGSRFETQLRRSSPRRFAAPHHEGSIKNTTAEYYSIISKYYVNFTWRIDPQNAYR